MAKICGKFRCKADVLVQDDFAGNAMVRSHMSSIECGYSFRVYGLMTWEGYGCL